MASLPDCTTHHGCKCREYVMAHLPDYEAAVDALERLLGWAFGSNAEDGTALAAEARAALHRLRGETADV